MIRLINSLRGRFILIGMVFLIGMVGFAVYTTFLVNLKTQEAEQALREYYHLEQSVVQEMNTGYLELEAGLYQHLIVLDEASQQAILNELLHIQNISNSTLLDSSGGEPTQELMQILSRIQQENAVLEQRIKAFFVLILSSKERFPAIYRSINELNPRHQSIMTQINLAMDEFDSIPGSEASKELLLKWSDVKEDWMRLVLQTSTMMSSRMGIFGAPEDDVENNHEAHQAWFDKLIKDLDTLNKWSSQGRMGFIQESALEAILIEAKAFEDNYLVIYEDMRSPEWRADLLFLREQMQPSFRKIHRLLSQLRVFQAENMGYSLQSSNEATEQIAQYIWGLALFYVAMIAVAFVFFKQSIFRPLQELGSALNAAAKEEDYALEAGRIEEINLLMEAFHNMQKQVRSRQIRLRSILENISDGVITIDERGRIETFNEAAQRLFGYSEDEVLGQGVALLMPQGQREDHQKHIEAYKATGVRHFLDREREEIALRKDGTFFPMSIKVKETFIEGARHFTAVVADISERKSTMERLRDMATKDSLTGIYNRRYYLEELERAVQRAIRGGATVTILYIDLDHFKFVNDTLGHQAGDQVLLEVTDILKGRVRTGDLFARLGGDEFALLLYDITPELAMTVADSYRKLLIDYRFHYDGHVVDVGCSIGVAPFSDDIRNKEELLGRADMACHFAKNAGRNRAHLFDVDNQRDKVGMSEDMGWTRRIKDAIAGDTFELFYQPIIHSHNWQVSGYEALIRMPDGDGGYLSPAAFMPAAERFGLMPDLDCWVIGCAIRDLHEHQKNNPQVQFTVNVNLSAVSLESKELAAYIQELLETHAVSPSRLTFEVTETTAITKLSHAREFLEGLNKLGCKTALDDFGTGYSSFSYLKDLPVDYVKIDGSFIQGIAEDRLKQVMVKSMNEVAHVMGKMSVAEFVETDTEARLLQELGVDYLQGYFIGKPERSYVIPEVTESLN